MNNMSIFTSSLGSFIEQYITHQRMKGYKFITGEEEMRQFDVFVAIKSNSTSCTKELVQDYIAYRPGEKPSTQCHRVSSVRCFAKYLVRCGIDAYILPKGVITVGKYDFVPYIFTTTEIARLLEATESLPHSGGSPQRHIVFSMMFRLIYGCGLRVSEANHLLIDDVNLETGVLQVRASKFNKDRYVPMAPSLLQHCRNYNKLQDLKRNSKSPFFPSQVNSFYSTSAIGYAFHQGLVIAGIPHTDNGPTVHSLRHSFAVHNLIRWGNEGKNVNALLPYLSAYLGHENLLGTERYLRMTVEMIPEMRERISAGCSWILPEVDCNER